MLIIIAYLAFLAFKVYIDRYERLVIDEMRSEFQYLQGRRVTNRIEQWISHERERGDHVIQILSKDDGFKYLTGIAF